MAETNFFLAPNDVMPMEIRSASDILINMFRSIWFRAKESKKKDKNGIRI